MGQKRYRRLFLIAVEGSKTESEYFEKLFAQDIIRIICIKHKNHGAPLQVLERLKKTLQNNVLKENDEAWVVVDRDDWTEEQLTQLYQWSQQDNRYGFALSNPKFEYWLLLHLEEGEGIHSAETCDKRLKKWWPNYDKSITPQMIAPNMINDAVRRAEKRDNPSCLDWPREAGKTTVYKLVKNILSI